MHLLRYGLICLAGILIAGCDNNTQTGVGSAYDPDISSTEFQVGVDSDYFPLPRGKQFVFEGSSAGGDVVIVKEVLELPHVVQGVPCTVVEVATEVDGATTEITRHYYAQAIDGTVWHFGQSTELHDNGAVVSTEGSWQAGTDGAKAAIVMLGDPQLGDEYQREYVPGVAEARARVISVTQSIVVPHGAFLDCVLVRRESEIDPTDQSQKHYAYGVGLVQHSDLATGLDVELVDVVDAPYEPHIDPADFVATIDNEHLPLTPGTLFHYVGSTDGELYEVDVLVTFQTKVILGVTCRAVQVSAWVEGELTEINEEYHAQDLHGNVWFFGESVAEYEDGVFASSDGSWEAGVDGAQPVISMLGNPQVGASYRVESVPGLGVDRAIVLATNDVIVVPYGRTNGCVRIQESTDTEADDADGNDVEDDEDEVEQKYYARNIGFVAEYDLSGSQWLELVSITDAP